MIFDRSLSSRVRLLHAVARPGRRSALALMAFTLGLGAMACTGDDSGCSEPIRERSGSAGTLDAGPAGLTRQLAQSHNAPIIQILEEAGDGVSAPDAGGAGPK